MPRLAPTSPLVLLTVGLGAALAAGCGGKSPAAGTAPSSSAGKPPFDQDAIKALVSATPLDRTENCQVDALADVGALMVMQHTSLASEGAVDERFTCVPSAGGDGAWECTWEVSQHVAPPAAGTVDADDPCGGEGSGSAYQVIVRVNDDGTLVPGQITCVAPG